MTTPAFTQPAAGWTRPPLEGFAATIADHVTGVIRTSAANDPRNLQVAIGPSEVGTPCTRRLAYQLLDWLDDKPNSDTDPLASIIGKATHTWLEENFDRFGETLPDGRARYLLEHRVHADQLLSGSCDMLDRAWNLVLDWKVPGQTPMAEYRKHGPGEQYRVQAHTYGLGYMRAGERVDHVAVVMLPRGGRLDGVYVWTEPFDPLVAVRALERRDNVRTAIVALDPETHPENWAAFPTAPAYCTYCPWYLPRSTDLSRGCPGAAQPQGGK